MAHQRVIRWEVRAHFLVRGLWGWLRFVSSANAESKGEKRMRRALVAVICAMALAGAIASSALAGEVTGPPGTSSGGNQTDTQGPSHSASWCVYSGLNDFNQGQVQTITQNWGQDVRLGIAGQEGPIPGVGCNPTISGSPSG